MTRTLVSYSGRVQGVGFRATCRRIAVEFEVKGWVKNMPDGTVELLAAGEKAEVEAFLKAIRDSPLGRLITREVAESAPVLEAPGGFEILH